ncbi:stress-induced-phosphoprotein 1-like isoform X2 [Halichondria panicea]|uniref:stress-induced-phosphoprotein 1-like isoform X2 n=1 Tax=Halichondria panicea TaxID=6063 RepID=UPI00312BA4E2
MSEPMDTIDPAQAEELKKKGNDAMKRGQLEEAIQLYTQAIQKDPSNHVLYSNRSAAYMKQEKYNEALEDANATIKIKPDWAKGYSRKGAALISMEQPDKAEEAYSEGLRLDPNNQDAKAALNKLQQDQRDFSNPFSGPDIERRLMANEKTRAFLQDPEFKRKLIELGKDPKNLMSNMQDHRVMEALAVLLEIDLKKAAELPPDPFCAKREDDENSGDEKKEETKSKTSGTGNVTSTDAKAKDTKDEALGEKEKGNAAYKKKDFVTALAHYDRAIELDPTNFTFLTNKAAVYFEQEEWELCIKTCEEVVEKGRDARADYKVISKALARIGNVHFKQGKLEESIKFYDHSLAEHRSPDVVKKKSEAQKRIKEAQRKAYIDPELALQEKEKGNNFFKKADYPSAMKHYNEAIKRDPENPIIYSNRAGCFQKLLEFSLALKDCEECIRLDPNFVKGHIRKGYALLAMRDTVKAMQAFQRALELDPNHAEARTGLQKCSAQDDPESRRKAALQDPEVEAILRDPAMQMVLQQMQKNPEALREHLLDPTISAKIQKLIESGFISLR